MIGLLLFIKGCCNSMISIISNVIKIMNRTDVINPKNMDRNCLENIIFIFWLNLLKFEKSSFESEMKIFSKPQIHL